MVWWKMDFDTVQYQQLVQIDLSKQRGVSLTRKGSFMVKYPHLRNGEPQSIIDDWQTPKVKFDGLEGNISGDPKMDHITRIVNADIVSTESILTFNAVTVDCLDNFIKESAELLDLDDGGKGYKVVNVLKVVDCFDYKQSDISYYNSGGIRKIKDYVFQNGCLGGQHIFKMKEHNYSKIIVSEELKNTVEKCKLIGANFQKMWD